MEEKYDYSKIKLLSRKASSFSKVKFQLNSYPNQSHYTGVKMKCRIKEIYESINEYNQKAKKKVNQLIKAQKNKTAKENVIIELRNDLAYHKNIMKNFKNFKQYSTEICKYYKENFDGIVQYKSDLVSDLNDFIKVLNRFEDDIVSYDKERKTMIQTNEEIIKYKFNEQKKMEDRIKKLNNELQVQEKKLKKINNIFLDYRNQNDTFIERFQKNEIGHLNEYEILEEKFRKLKSQYEYYYNKEVDKRKNELKLKDKNLCKEEEDSIDLKLQDNIVKNIFLKNIAEEIKNQIEEIEQCSKKNEEEEKIIKFYGKTFYDKIIKRRMETEQNENLNSISNENKFSFSEKKISSNKKKINDKLIKQILGKFKNGFDSKLKVEYNTNNKIVNLRKNSTYKRNNNMDIIFPSSCKL